MAHRQTARRRHRHVTRPACDPRCYWLLPHKPLPNREALVLWIRLRPFRQVADIWLLRPEDNLPNPCGIQVTTASRRRGRSFYDRLSSLIYDLKPASTGLFASAARQESIPRQTDRFVPSPDLSVKHRGHRAGTERYLSRFLITREMHELSWHERDRRH